MSLGSGPAQLLLALLCLAGAVGTVQGVAWLGGGAGRRARVWGAVLAPAGLLLLALALLLLLVPEFLVL